MTCDTPATALQFAFIMLALFAALAMGVAVGPR